MTRHFLLLSLLFLVQTEPCSAEQEPATRSIISIRSAGKEVAKIQLPIGLKANYQIHANHIENNEAAGVLRAVGNVQITLNLAGSSASEIDLIGDELVLTKHVLDAHKVQAIRELETMGESDQRYRQIAPIDANAARLQTAIDVANIKRLAAIIEQYGWPGAGWAGIRASQSAFLVLQHADLQHQQKYFPLMREASKHNDALPSELATLEDRMRIGMGLAQIYGTQMGADGKLLPLEDPAQVEHRRAQMGLPALIDSLKYWDRASP